jgi:hypothetical protein
MTEAVLTHRDITMPLPLPDVTALAERVLTWALELCAKRMGLDGVQAAADRVRQGNTVARMHCCSSIARQVAESLGTSERNVQAIYAPDYDALFWDLCSDAERSESMVRLLVWTRRKTSEFDSLVSAWDRALAQACSEKLGAHEQAPSLDVQVMDDTDLERHFGSGRRRGMATRLAVYWMRTMNQAVDIVYTRRDT